MAGQKQNGTTFNSTVSIDPKTGNYVFSFTNPFNVVLNLKNSDSLIVNGDGTNGRYNLQNATNTVINANSGNDIFNVSATAGGLNGNVLHGSKGYDFITAAGSTTAIDLTDTTNGVSNGIEAVVGNKGANGMSTTLSLSLLSTSSLTNGGTGRAFAAVVGDAGTVSVLQVGKFKLVGVVDAAHHGFTATGDAITGDALTTLLASVTDISAIKGNLATMYAGNANAVANDTHIGQLNAYVFSDGAKAYTIWTDGTVTPTDAKGVELDAVYQPTAVTPDQATNYGTVDVFNTGDDYASAVLGLDANGAPVLNVNDGNTAAHSAILIKADVTGVTIHGDAGANGSNWFGLGLSGGENHIIGSKGGNVFDLQTSTSLIDYLAGGAGFDIVRAAADGADVDLTKNGSTGKAATNIEAVVGGSNLSTIQTVEFDAGQAKYAANASGAKVAAFTALLGSADDTLTLTGAGKWVQVASFAPGSAAPSYAAALTNADLLDAAFAQTQHKAAASLTGYVYEQVGANGNAVKFLTVYTDATIDNQLALATQVNPIHDAIII